jgi:tetratricopeptide (TPR) repeat protein
MRFTLPLLFALASAALAVGAMLLPSVLDAQGGVVALVLLPATFGILIFVTLRSPQLRPDGSRPRLSPIGAGALAAILAILLATAALGSNRASPAAIRARLAVWDTAVALHPSAAMLVARARFEEEMGLADRAVGDCEKAIGLAPEFASARFNLALATDMKGDHVRAIALYGDALRLDPDDKEALANRGYSYYEDGQYDRARSDLDAAVRLDPDFAYARVDRGATLAALGQHELAIADFDAALRASPNDGEVLLFRAKSEMALGRYDPAVGDLDRVIARYPRLADPYRLRGLAKFGKGDRSAAAADFAMVVRAGDAYAALWQFLALPPGPAADAALAQGAANLHAGDWPAPLLAAYRNDAAADAARAAATSPDERCDADFYLGALALVRGDQAVRGAIDSVASECARLVPAVKALLDGTAAHG